VKAVKAGLVAGVAYLIVRAIELWRDLGEAV
jgi:hypothetical protein